MLCPKCGFISFDHLSVCGKCRNDLAGIGMDLRGTAVDVECRLFLGGALKETFASHDDQPVSEAAVVAVDFPFEQEKDSDAATDGVDFSAPQEGVEQGEAAVEVDFSGEEPSALEFELDEITLGGNADIAPAEAEDKVEGDVLGTEEVGVTLLDFADEDSGGSESNALPKDESEMESEVLEIDTSTLILDSFEEEPGKAVSSEDGGQEGQSGQLAIDLDAIDLSDLVHGQDGAASASGGATVPGEESLDFEDTMDLSLFIGEAPDVSPIDAEQSSPEKGPDPIDLSLVDEALIDLAVDPGRQSQSPSEESHSDILELSMEDSSK